MKKQIFAAILCCIIAWSVVSAQKDIKSPGHLSLGIELFSTTGFGLELGTPLGSNFALRGGISLLPIKAKTTFDISISENMIDRIDAAIAGSSEIRTALSQNGLPTSARNINTDADVTGALGLINGKLLFDYYPSAKYGFHLTAGVYIGPAKLLKGEGRMEEAIKVLDVLKTNGVDLFNETFTVDSEKGYQLTGKDLTNINGAVKINSVKPYLGLGFGRAVPKRRVNVNFEIGAFYQGKPKITSDSPNMQKFIDSELTDVTSILNKWSIYPVMSLKLNFRIF